VCHTADTVSLCVTLLTLSSCVSWVLTLSVCHTADTVSLCVTYADTDILCAMTCQSVYHTC